MTGVYIIGAGMIRFGKYPDKSVRTMAEEATRLALQDAGLVKEDLQSVFFSNSFWGMLANQHSIASKVFCTNGAYKVASDAVQIFGGLGLSKELPIEKIFRDARAGLIEDGSNDSLSIAAGNMIVREVYQP